MTFPLTVAAVLLVPTLVLMLLIAAVQWFRGRLRRSYFVTAGWVHAALFVLHLFVTFPALLGWWGSRMLGTRPDERAYQGPKILADGSWQLQTRESLRADAEHAPPPAVVDAQRALGVSIPGANGVVLHAYRVPAEQAPPRAVALLVHGLFRSAMEIEAPAAMLRRAGCECYLLEQRNHGGSGRAPATFGQHESEDVVAAVRYVRAQPGLGELPLLLYGVSLGTVSVALALPRLEHVGGVVLDAPVDDLLATAHRMLGLQRPGDRRRFFAMVEPWRSLVVLSLEQWSGFDLAALQPAVALQGVSAQLPMLLIGGEHDDKVPASSVQALYDSLPMAAPTKELWLVEGAGHGDAFHSHAAEYERHLDAFVRRLAGP